jgi:hypothetical protein
MPTGIPKYKIDGLGPSQNTQRLLDSMRDLEERLAAEKRKDRARALLVHFAQKHGLDATDLRTAAKLVGDRKVGDAPVYTKRGPGPGHGKVKTAQLGPAKTKIGKAIRKARVKLDLSDRAVGAAIGCDGTLVGRWQRGIDRVPERYYDKLVEVVKLPKTTFPAPAKALSNGAAAH